MLDRAQFASLEPMGSEALMEKLGEYQKEGDACEAAADDFNEKRKAAVSDQEGWAKKVSLVLRARRAAEPVYLLVGGELTTEKPADPALFDQQSPPPPKAESPKGKKKTENAEAGAGEAGTIPMHNADEAVPGEIIEAIDTFQSGRKTKDERREAARTIVAYLRLHGPTPKGMDRDQLLANAERVIGPKDASRIQQGARKPVEGAPHVKVTSPCVETVTAIPVYGTGAIQKGHLLLAPSGEVLEVETVRPRRLEIVVKRGQRGTTAALIDTDAVLSQITDETAKAATPAPDPVLAGAPEL